MPEVYILQSLTDKKTYVGCTSNLEQRLEYHATGRVPSTRHRRPFNVLLTESFLSLRDAKKRERWWKSGAGRRKLKELFKTQLGI